MSTTTDTSRCIPLPPEIIVHVIQFLPKSGRKACLFVSRRLHDLAFPEVFSSVTVHFGAWEGHYPEEVYEQEMPDAHWHALMDARNALSAEILRHMALDSSFARAVRRLEIRAFEQHWLESCCEYQLRDPGPLSSAIRSLCNLRSFIWYGTCPLPSPEIVKTLGQACPLLHTISLPPHESHSTLPFGLIQSLRSITLCGLHFPLEPLIPREVNMAAIDTGTLRLQDLRELHLPIFVLPLIPPTLTHLEIHRIHSIEPLVASLQQLPCLQSLAVCCFGVQDLDLLLHVLVPAQNHRPQLTSLALSLGLFRQVTWAQIHLLLDVLGQQPTLRRFRIFFRSAHEYWTQFLNGLSVLKNLEVLGLDLGPRVRVTTPDVIDILARTLPRSLTALSIFIEATEPVEAGAFRPLWLCCPRLGYLHTWLSRVNVQVRDVIAGAQSLRLLGHGEDLYDIVYEGGAPVASGPWPVSKVMFRQDEDLCAEWEWLLRDLRLLKYY